MKIKISEVIIDEELYPRDNVDKGLVEAYSLNIEDLPPIVLSKNNILVDGQHRLLAHSVAGEKEIEAEMLDITDRHEIFREAIRRNAKHGKQFTIDEKKKLSKILLKSRMKVQEIAKDLAVSDRFVRKWTEKEREEEDAERNAKILMTYLRCHTQEEIADEVGVSQGTISNVIDSIIKNGTDAKINIEPNLYDVWHFLTNDDKYGFKDYPGRIPGQIVENVVHRYTKPFDIVVDPFAGSGTTMDVCKAMLRRYRVYDINPVSDEIKKWNLKEGYPVECKGCDLIFLDPPYYKKKEKEYDKRDEGSIANLSREEYLSFFEKLAAASYDILKKDGHLALIMSNYIDYTNNGGSIFAYHYANFFEKAGFVPVIEIQCPLSTQQYKGLHVEQAKILGKILVISRSLFIFKK